MNTALQDAIAREDRDEQFGEIEADDRLTCHEHQAWADAVHMERFHR